jgi:hypothetical protein
MRKIREVLPPNQHLIRLPTLKQNRSAGYATML